jgi:hypothetical protein
MGIDDVDQMGPAAEDVAFQCDLVSREETFAYQVQAAAGNSRDNFASSATRSKGFRK